LLGSAAVRAASSILAILFQFPLLGSEELKDLAKEKPLYLFQFPLLGSKYSDIYFVLRYSTFNSLCWVPS